MNLELESTHRANGTHMTSILESIAGPRKGEIFRWEDAILSIGRDPSNRLPILDSALSRHHCQIERQGDSHAIRDLDSRNGTLLNGAPLLDELLRSGDEIKLGASAFIFRYTAEVAALPISGLKELEGIGGSTIILRKENAIYLSTPERMESLQPTPRALRDLNALLRISQTINSVHRIEDLEKQILEAIFEVSPADRAAILLTNIQNGEIGEVCGCDRKLGPQQSIQVSQTVLNAVMAEGIAVISNDVMENEEFVSAGSLIAHQVHSVLAVPMEFYGKVSGVIYLEASNPRANFDAELLELMRAMGSIAAVAYENTQRMEWLECENRRLKEESGIEHKMIGESRQMLAVYQFIQKVAKQDATVLVWGESGTGKELVARAIHENSLRKWKPCVALNCAAITDTLLESELFGHEKGAFTGAQVQKKGKLELAEGGTIFLDEVGELAPLLQAKLLRVLQEREFERVGGNKTIKIDIRVITATNRDLREMVKQGRFREDLYYRLNVVSIRMPALRERPDDIQSLASHFAKKFALKTGRRIDGISLEARRYLLQYNWPGNVRELENALERAVVMSAGGMLDVDDLPENLLETASPQEAAAGSFHGELQGTKRQMVVRALEQSRGNVTEAAKILHVHANYLHRLMNNLGIDKKRKAMSAAS